MSAQKKQRLISMVIADSLSRQVSKVSFRKDHLPTPFRIADTNYLALHGLIERIPKTQRCRLTLRSQDGPLLHQSLLANPAPRSWPGTADNVLMSLLAEAQFR
jgi:hypothetical protein